MPTINANGANLYYTEKGSGEETVVFSHGYLLNSDQFYYQQQVMSSEYRCLAYDHRGHGQSEATKDGYELENLYQDAVAFLEETNATPCHFVGLSTGGYIGMRLGFRRPDLLRSLILMDTAADLDPPAMMRQYRMMSNAVRWVGTRPLLNRVMPLMFGHQFLTDVRRTAEMTQWRNRINQNDPVAISKFGNGLWSREPVLDDLPKINIPTLIIVGAEDVATPPEKAEQMAELIPNAQKVVIPFAGHSSPIEEPIRVTEAIQTFLQNLPETEPA